MSDVDPQRFPRVPSGVFEDLQFLRKYELERELGIGGAGVVVCARHRELDERVAIKFLLSGYDNPEIVARFRREARAAHRVRNEHVVGIVDVSTTDTGVPYVVMEYLEGTDLERMLLESPDNQLPVRDAIEFVLQACEALAECHAIGIVHRDLKPSNLFCTQGADGLPIIKVLDFGISKLGTVTVDAVMTGSNAIMGSPRYMSPEQFATPANVDRRADIWALGVMLYELVTGKAPFVGTTLIGIWERVKKDTPKPIEELRRDAPRSLGPIVLHCLEKDREQRYQTVADLAKALLPLASERMRATVARIVRIVEAPGVTTESLSLPPSGPPSTHGATSVSVPSGAVQQRASRNLGIALAVAAGTIVVVWVATHPATSTSSPPSGAISPAASLAPVAPVEPAPTATSTATVTAATATSPVATAAAPTPPVASAMPVVSSRPRTPPSPTGHVASRPVEPTPTAPIAPTAATAPTPASNPALPSVASLPSASPAPPVGERNPKDKAAPWIMDVVEQRRGKTGGSE
jgi:eukaryotic-like serine/threonine-protein kinase